MALWRKTKPATSTRVVSAEVRGNFEALDEALLGATALAQASPDMTVAVTAFEWLKSDGTTRGNYTGGNSPTIVAPGANPRIAVLAIDDAGTLAWTYGTEAASPSAPAYPENTLPIVDVFQRVAMTSIKDADDGTHGYIRRQPTRLRALRSAGATALFRFAGNPFTNVVSTAAETSIFSGGAPQIPGNTLGTSGRLRIKVRGDFLNDTGAGDKFTIRVKWGGSTILTLSPVDFADSTPRYPWNLVVELEAAGASNTQVARAEWRADPAGITGGSVGSLQLAAASHHGLTVDSTTTQTLDITVQNDTSNANESTRVFTVLVESV